jgi:hypothetical protein
MAPRRLESYNNLRQLLPVRGDSLISDHSPTPMKYSTTASSHRPALTRVSPDGSEGADYPIG